MKNTAFAALNNGGAACFDDWRALNENGPDINLRSQHMNKREKTYKGHLLTARQEPAGWQVEIGETGFRSGFHSNPSGAFAEAERWVDARL